MAYDASRASRDDGGRPRGVLLFRLSYVSGGLLKVVRLASSAQRIRIPGNAIEADPAIYYGAGRIGSWPDIEQALNFTFSRVTFVLGGSPIDKDVIAAFRSEWPDLHGATVNLGFQELDARAQLVGVPVWDATGQVDVMDTPHTSQASGEIEQSLSMTINLGYPGRRRPRSTGLNDAAFQRRSPGDKALSNVARYHAGSPLAWGTR